MGSGTAGIATWRKQNTGATGTFDVHRTTSFSSTGANAVTVEMGATGAETGTQKIIDAYTLVTNVPTIYNWWEAVPGASYFQGYASTTGVNGTSSGYTFS